MKVAYINTVCGRSSTGRIVTDLNSILADAGGSGLCLYGRYNAPNGINSECIDRKIDIYSHVLLTRLLDMQGFGSRGATRRAVESLKRFKPDVVHLHNLHGSYINIDILFQYLRESDIPVVWTLHDCWAFTGHCAHYLYDNCRKWETETCGDCPRKKEYPASFLLDGSKRNYERKKSAFTSIRKMEVVAVSEWLAGEASRSFLGKYPIRCIYNGIDRSIFRATGKSNSSLGIDSANKIVLCVADGWSERKGLSLLLDVNRRIEEQCLPFTIVMVGVQQELNRRLPSSIIALPRTDSLDDLVSLYNRADVLFNPSEVETFGLVNVEALSCGTPAVVMDGTACPETVNESCGVVVSPGMRSVDQIVDAFFKLTESEGISEKCISFSERFSSDRTYAQYIALYESLLEDR